MTSGGAPAWADLFAKSLDFYRGSLIPPKPRQMNLDMTYGCRKKRYHELRTTKEGNANAVRVNTLVQ